MIRRFDPTLRFHGHHLMAKFALLAGIVFAGGFASAPNGLSCTHSCDRIFRVAERGQEDQEFKEIVALVRRRGWPADLGRICRVLGLEGDRANCVVQQISFFVSDSEGHAFNLMPLEPGAVSYVVIFSLASNEGRFYLASPTGQLISSSILDANAKPEPAEVAREHFARELAYWKANVAQFDRWLEKRNYGPVPPLKSQP